MFCLCAFFYRKTESTSLFSKSKIRAMRVSYEICLLKVELIIFINVFCLKKAETGIAGIGFFFLTQFPF